MTGFGAAESDIGRRVLRSFIIISMLVFIVSWLAVAISNFGSARITGVVASMSETVVFSRVKAGHQSGKGYHGFGSFLAEVTREPFIPDAMFEGREGFCVRTVVNLVLFD